MNFWVLTASLYFLNSLCLQSPTFWITQLIHVKINLSPINFHPSAQPLTPQLQQTRAMQRQGSRWLIQHQRGRYSISPSAALGTPLAPGFWQNINQISVFSFERALPWAHGLVCPLYLFQFKERRSFSCSAVIDEGFFPKNISQGV